MSNRACIVCNTPHPWLLCRSCRHGHPGFYNAMRLVEDLSIRHFNTYRFDPIGKTRYRTYCDTLLELEDER